MSEDEMLFVRVTETFKLEIIGYTATTNAATDWRVSAAEAARAVLVETGCAAGGRPGGFVRALIEALMNADRTNRALVSAGFPALATAVAIFKDHPDGVALLQRLAGVPVTEGS